jgi:alkylation response protein AidB-like acyl-CoA dehydrogenase
LLEETARWAATALDDEGRRVIDDPINRERLARVAIGNEVARLLGHRAAWLAARGEMPAVEGSMAKLWTSETFQAAAAELLDMLGAAGQLGHVDGAPVGGLVEHFFRHSQVTTIYGGSSEVQRGIIAERGLGLPRSR